VDDSHSLQLAVVGSASGSTATAKLIRNGAEKTVSLKLAELPGSVAQNGIPKTPPASTATDALDGVSVDDLSPDARRQLGIPADLKGAIVTDVGQNSNAADAGLHPNDVIVEINRQAVVSSQNAVDLCIQAKGKRILVKVWRREEGYAGMHFLSVDNTKRK